MPNTRTVAAAVAVPSDRQMAADVTIAGTITYDCVPVVVSRDSQGRLQAKLDYDATARYAVASAVVTIIDPDTRRVLADTLSDVAGAYALAVPPNVRAMVRVEARMMSADIAPDGRPAWEVAVRDNHSEEFRVVPEQATVYALESEPFDTGAHGRTVALHAGSGWSRDLQRYPATRPAAPFAILAAVHQAIQCVLAVDRAAVFAPLNVFWHPHNVPETRNPHQEGATPDDPLERLSRGYIGTSFFKVTPPGSGIYLLGAQNVDTDEYHPATIIHEWAHYFENVFSRADNGGGAHEEHPDMRSGFTEAWANALSSIVRGTPVYATTCGQKQASTGAAFDLDEIGTPRTWYGEMPISHALYQWAKSAHIGFQPIYDVMVNDQRRVGAFTSLLSFAARLRKRVGVAGQGEIDRMLRALNTVDGAALDEWGTRQRVLPADIVAPQDQRFVLPIYTELTLDEPSPPLCLTDKFNRSEAGKASRGCVGNRRFLRFTLVRRGNYRVVGEVVPSGPQNLPLPYFDLYLDGTRIAHDPADANGWVYYDLPPATYAAEIYPAAQQPLAGCFRFTLKKA